MATKLCFPDKFASSRGIRSRLIPVALGSIAERNRHTGKQHAHAHARQSARLARQASRSAA